MGVKISILGLFLLSCLWSKANSQVTVTPVEGCPQGPQTAEEYELYHVLCDDKSVNVTSAVPVNLADITQPGKVTYLYGFEVLLDSAVTVNGTNITVVAHKISGANNTALVLNTTGVSPVRYRPEDKAMQTSQVAGQDGPDGVGVVGEYGTNAGNVSLYVEKITNLGNIFIDARGGNPVYGQGGGDANDGFNADSNGCGGDGGKPGVRGNSSFGGLPGIITVNNQVNPPWIRSNISIPMLNISNSYGKIGKGGPGADQCNTRARSLPFDLLSLGKAGADGCYPSVNGVCRQTSCELALKRTFINGQDPAIGFTPQPPYDPYYNQSSDSTFTIGAGRDTTPAGFLRAYAQDLQISMVFASANAAFYAEQFTSAREQYNYVINTTANCTKELCPGLQTANLTGAEAQVRIDQMNIGINYYGRQANYVPLQSYTDLRGEINRLRDVAQALYASYQSYWKLNTDATSRRITLQNTVSRNDDRQRELERDLITIARQEQIAFDEFQVIAAQRGAYGFALLKDAKDLQKAVARIGDFGDDLYGFLSFAATVAVDVALDVAGFDALTGQVQKFGYGPIGLVNGAVATDKFIGSALIPTDLLDYASQNRNSTAPDSAKLLISNREWNAYVQRYKDLDEAKTYTRDLDKYMQACKAASSKALLYTSLYRSYNQTKTALDSVAAQTSVVKEQLQDAKVNPASAYFGQYVSRAFKSTLETFKSATQELFQVYKYNTLLVQQPFPYAGPGIDGLIKASSDVLDLFDKQRQIYGNTFQATKARTIVLDPTTVANYTQGLEAGSIVFYINASDPAFGNKKQVYVTDFKLNFNGIVARGSNTYLLADLVHSGAATVVDLTGTPLVFTHQPQLSEYEYDVRTGDVITPGTINPGLSPDKADFLPISPFTWWRIDFTRALTDFNFSAVDSISLDFNAIYRKPNPTLLLSASSKGGLSNTPLSNFCLLCNTQLTVMIGPGSSDEPLALNGSVSFTAVPTVASSPCGNLTSGGFNLGTAAVEKLSSGNYTADIEVNLLTAAGLKLAYESLSGNYDVIASLVDPEYNAAVCITLPLVLDGIINNLSGP